MKPGLISVLLVVGGLLSVVDPNGFYWAMQAGMYIIFVGVAL